MNTKTLAPSPPSTDQVLDNLIEEICARLETGEPIDLERLSAAYPHLADRLQNIYAMAVELNRVGLSTGLRQQMPGDAVVPEGNFTLGDFRILRQIGRGGMGVVYEAEQISIPRRVALKVLPLAALVDPRALQRFRNEVAAIATLEHPHIVPVYAIGEDRGIHYYAMKLIRGQSLAAVIKELRNRADRDERLSGDAIQQALSDIADPPADGQPLDPVELDAAAATTQAADRADPFAPSSDALLPSSLSASESSLAAHHNLSLLSPVVGGESPAGSGRRGGGGESSAPNPEGRPSPAASCVRPSHQEGEKRTAETRARARSSTRRNQTDQTYFRNVAQLMIQAAEALQHAHDHGIVHRDIKPGNLLLDADGNIHITDFGLARIETSPGVTMTGDILGTLRYMSPEQVQGNQQVIDHRADIYSLGATFYELLTLQPMWKSDDKAELIRQISLSEPIRLQKINTSIPKDLETVILKSISKATHDRYGDARALAGDLTHFLEHRPVTAKPLKVGRRISKWAQRNRQLVSVALIGVCLLTVGLGVSNFFTLQQRNIAIRKTEEANSNSIRAERNLDRALEAVDRLLSRFGGEQLQNTPQAEQLRKNLLEDALAICESIIDDENSHPEPRRRTASAYHSVAVINAELGHLDESIQGFKHAAGLWRDWLTQFPTHASYRDSEARLAGTYQNLAALITKRGDFEEAEKYSRQSIDIREQIVAAGDKDPPHDVEFDLAVSTVNHADLLRQTERFGEAITTCQRGIDRLKQLVERNSTNSKYYVYLAWAHHHNALNYRDTLDEPTAIAECQKAISILNSWREKADDQGWARIQFAEVTSECAQLLATSQPADAKKLADRSVEECRWLCREFPDTERYTASLCDSLSVLANIQWELGDRAQAKASFEEALRIEEATMAKAPTDLDWIDRQARHVYNFGNLLYQLGEELEGEKQLLRCIELEQRIIAASPSSPALAKHHRQLAMAHDVLAGHLHEQGKTEAAIAKCRETMEVLKPLTGMHRSDPKARFYLASAYNRLASIHLETESYTAAASVLTEGLPVMVELAKEQPEVEDFASLLLGMQTNLAICHAASGNLANAEEAFLKCIEYLDRQIKKHPHEPILRSNLSGMRSNLARVYRLQAKYPLSEQQYEMSHLISRELIGMFPGMTPLKSQLADDYDAFAETLAEQGKFAEAEKNWLQCLEIRKQIADEEGTCKCLGQLAHNCMSASRYDAAIEYFDLLVPKLARMHGPTGSQTLLQQNDFAIALKEAGRFETAREQLAMIIAAHRETIAKQPDDVKTTVLLGGAYVNLGNVDLDQKQYEAAIENYLQAVQILEDLVEHDPPQNAALFLHNALNQCGTARLQQGAYEDALRDFRRALSLAESDDQRSELHLKTGQCLGKLKQWDSAVESLVKAAKFDRTSEAAFFELARVHALSGKKEAALEALKACVRAGFNDLAAIEQNAELETVRNDPEYQQILAELKRGSREGSAD